MTWKLHENYVTRRNTAKAEENSAKAAAAVVVAAVNAASATGNGTKVRELEGEVVTLRGVPHDVKETGAVGAGR